MIRFTIIAACLLGAISLHAQHYNTAMGLRLSQYAGLTLQQRVGKSLTLEGMLQHGFLSSQSIATLLVQKHQKLVTSGLGFYVGAGGHVSRYRVPALLKSQAFMATAPGISLIGGLEATVGRTVISIDYKPAFNAGSYLPLYQGEAGLSLRYVLVKQSKSPKSRSPFFQRKGRRSA